MTPSSKKVLPACRLKKVLPACRLRVSPPAALNLVSVSAGVEKTADSTSARHQEEGKGTDGQRADASDAGERQLKMPLGAAAANTSEEGLQSNERRSGVGPSLHKPDMKGDSGVMDSICQVEVDAYIAPCTSVLTFGHMSPLTPPLPGEAWPLVHEQPPPSMAPYLHGRW